MAGPSQTVIELKRFEEADIPRLIGWIPDARFLLQWAGPQYSYPLDRAQLLDTIRISAGEKPPHFMFKAVDRPAGTVVGHVELMGIDYASRSAFLGRALIGDAGCRGRGHGKAMIKAAVNYAFDTIGVVTLNLGVFDFNAPAIACYSRLGFSEYERRPNARRFGGEYWTLIMMRIEKRTWKAE